MLFDAQQGTGSCLQQLLTCRLPRFSYESEVTDYEEEVVEPPLKFDDIVDRRTYDKMRPPKPGGEWEASYQVSTFTTRARAVLLKAGGGGGGGRGICKMPCIEKVERRKLFTRRNILFAFMLPSCQMFGHKKRKAGQPHLRSLINTFFFVADS